MSLRLTSDAAIRAVDAVDVQWTGVDVVWRATLAGAVAGAHSRPLGPRQVSHVSSMALSLILKSKISYFHGRNGGASVV
jgi:hypothetical protein